MKTITVQVVQQHIDRGLSCKPTGCALAIAIDEAIPLCEAQVGIADVNLIPLVGGWETNKTVILPDEARQFVKRFDAFARFGRERPEPFSFTLDVPEEFVAIEPKRDLSVRVNAPSDSVFQEKEENHVPA